MLARVCFVIVVCRTPKLVYYMRAANLILAALMITSALLTIITAANFQLASWVLAFYVM